MSAAEGFVSQLAPSLKFFKTSISVFEETDSAYAPQPELFTVAAHVAHVAATVEWFVEGAFGAGWDTNFEKQTAAAQAVTSLAEAVARLDKAYARATDVVGGASDEQLFAPIEDLEFLEGAPRCAIVNGITDHTAHHRGALTVYARLLGKEPVMPYA